MVGPEDIIGFWLSAGPKRWFAKDEAFDTEIRDRFAPAIAAAKSGALDGWAETRDGRLALILLLDQFTRNIHRGSADAFSGDARALDLARRAIAADDFDPSDKHRSQWLLMPFEHHEGMAEQEMAVDLAEQLGDAELVKFAKVHRDIIRDFGRFPHRNRVLGRETTDAERDFLAEGGFSG